MYNFTKKKRIATTINNFTMMFIISFLSMLFSVTLTIALEEYLLKITCLMLSFYTLSGLMALSTLICISLILYNFRKFRKLK